MKLYLVRGHDIDSENQDWFIIASNVERAVELWNDHLIENGFPRCDGDQEFELPRQKLVDPHNVREILADVTGTKFDGTERAVEWDEMTVVG